jgi:hypothetical protein
MVFIELKNVVAGFGYDWKGEGCGLNGKDRRKYLIFCRLSPFFNRLTPFFTSLFSWMYMIVSELKRIAAGKRRLICGFRFFAGCLCRLVPPCAASGEERIGRLPHTIRLSKGGVLA